MSVATVHSRAQMGLHAPAVSVEVHLSGGLPALNIVGLPETAVRESKDRVRSALLNAGYEFPLKRITINLAPADLPKEGARFDLPIALGILAASGQVPLDALDGVECVGELALDGSLRPLRGALPTALAAASAGRELLLPAASAAEAALAASATVRGASALREVCAHLRDGPPLPAWESPPLPLIQRLEAQPDLSEVRGQLLAKRALEVAAAGGHHLLYLGAPGSGKSMLAQRLLPLLPPMQAGEAADCAAIASVSRPGFRLEDWCRRPYRAPHHTASPVALIGGGSPPRPGEVSLAHGGVLFLDELPEFDRVALEVLREPLERRSVTLSRATWQAEFPAGFQLVAAMNPCPCGHLGDPTRACRCTPDQIQRYRGRISGPLLDRIDLQVQVPPVAAADLFPVGQTTPGERTAEIALRVAVARGRAIQRQGCANGELRGVDLLARGDVCETTVPLLQQAASRRGLSARAVHAILRVGRTIADLAGSERVESGHVLEAISLRDLDRKGAPPPGMCA
jgi:magnesium chelatase family protein